MNKPKKSVLSVHALAPVLLLAAPALAADGEGTFTLATGAEYTTGEYGGEKSIDEIYVPVTGYYDQGDLSFRLTVPFLQVRAPEGTITEGPNGDIIIGEGPIQTERGLGDVVASLTVFNAFTTADRDFALDFTGKIKFGTADKDKGLGTGETDYSAQVDAYRFFDRFTAIGTLGYMVRGDPEGADLDNSVYASLGGSYYVSAETRVGFYYDWRQASIPDNDDPQEVSVMVSRRLDAAWILRFYALAGLSDSSPDAGVGIVASKEF